MHGSGLIFDAAAILGREVVPRRIDVANPGAGNELLVKVPGGSLWFVQTLRLTFTASAVVASRQPQIVLADSDSAFWSVDPPQGVTAGNATQFFAAIGYGMTDTLAGPPSQRWVPWPAIPLPGGWAIRSVTSNLDVGDAYSAVTLYVLEVEETPYMTELARDVAALRSGRSDPIPSLANRG